MPELAPVTIATRFSNSEPHLPLFVPDRDILTGGSYEDIPKTHYYRKRATYVQAEYTLKARMIIPISVVYHLFLYSPANFLLLVKNVRMQMITHIQQAHYIDQQVHGIAARKAADQANNNTDQNQPADLDIRVILTDMAQ